MMGSSHGETQPVAAYIVEKCYYTIPVKTYNSPVAGRTD